jgi:hypothetical protein
VTLPLQRAFFFLLKVEGDAGEGEEDAGEKKEKDEEKKGVSVLCS